MLSNVEDVRRVTPVGNYGLCIGEAPTPLQSLWERRKARSLSELENFCVGLESVVM